MNKQQFLSELKHYLKKLPASDVKDIISDQEEFIRDAMADGRKEEDVIKAIGSPKEMADTLIAEHKVQRIQEADSLTSLIKAILGSIGAVIILAPINFLILLGPVLVGFTIITTLFALGAGFFFGGFAGIYIYLTHVLSMAVGMAAHLTTIFLSLGFVGLGAIFLFVTYFTTYALGQAFISYFNWNLNFIRKNS